MDCIGNLIGFGAVQSGVLGSLQSAVQDHEDLCPVGESLHQGPAAVGSHQDRVNYPFRSSIGSFSSSSSSIGCISTVISCNNSNMTSLVVFLVVLLV